MIRSLSAFPFQGCYHSIVATIEAYLNPVLITIIVLVTVEVLAVIFAVCLCKAIDRDLRSRK